MNEELGEFSVCYTITFRRTSRHSPARLWRAITDPEEVGKWMTYPARIDLRVGGHYFVDFSRTANPREAGEAPGGVPDDATLNGVIVAIEPERLLRYAWGTSVVDWRIEPDGTGSRHTFSQNGLHPRDVPDEEGLAAGWHSFLEGLDTFLAGGRPLPDEAEKLRWNELKRLYRPLLAEVVPLE